MVGQSIATLVLGEADVTLQLGSLESATVPDFLVQNSTTGAHFIIYLFSCFTFFLAFIHLILFLTIAHYSHHSPLK